MDGVEAHSDQARMRSPQIIRVLRFAGLRSSWVHVNCCFQVPGLLDEQREGDVGELFSLAQWSNSLFPSLPNVSVPYQTTT